MIKKNQGSDIKMFDLEFSELLDEDDFGRKEFSKPPLPTHCNVPLKYSAARAALGKPAPGQYVSKNNMYKKEFQLIQRLTGDIHIHGMDLSRHQYRLLNCLEIQDRTVISAEWKQQINVADEIWKLNRACINSTLKLPIPISYVNHMTSNADYLYKSYLIKAFWEEGVLSSGSPHCKPMFWWIKDGQVSHTTVGSSKFFVTPNLFLIQSPEGSVLLSRDHLLILSDLASQRYLLRVTSILDGTGEHRTFISPEELDKFLINGDLMLYYGGNEAYKLVYGLEPLCVSELVGDIPVGRKDAPTFKQIIRDDQTKVSTRLRIKNLLNQRFEFIDSFKDTPMLLAQLHGLYRIWGHPTIEPLDGASALKKIATSVRLLQTQESDAITVKFKEEFIKRYIRYHNHWPELDCSRLKPDNIIRGCYENKSIFPQHHKSYKREHLLLVDFTQVFPVDPKFDLIEMLSDKALSLFTPDLLDHLARGTGVGSAIERSVLIKWLQSDLHDPEEFLRIVDKNGFSYMESSVGLKEKEREGKLDPRMFGLMTLFKRMYIVLTEAMLAEHILPLFPEITMIDDEISLDKKRHQFNRAQIRDRSMFTSLDFSKWNSNMREEETRGVFKVLDQVFGFTNLFQRTHEMFKFSFMYLLNGSYIPSISSGQFIPDLGGWYGHLGGIEGLRQKGWTLWTVTLILLASENQPLQLRLMGQGDNQVLREIFPVDMSREDQMQTHFSFIARLNDILSKIGPPLKMEETWTSRDLYIYGKYFIYRGCPLPTYAKRICRMFRLSNEDFPTTESAISSLTANLSAALSCNISPGSVYWTYLLELTGLFQLLLRIRYLQPIAPYEFLQRPQILRIPGKAKLQQIRIPSLLSDTLLHHDYLYTQLILLPRPLGGFPVSSLPQALLRGFPDEVTFCISFLKSIYPHASQPIRNYIRKILNPQLNSEISYQLIFEHPTCLNLLIPPAPGESRRHLIIDFLKSSNLVSNRYFVNFIAMLKSSEEDELISYLAQSRPFSPRVLGLIASSTVEARARHMAGKLQKTRTISQLAVQDGQKDIYSAVQIAEKNHLLSVMRIVLMHEPGNLPWTPTTCSLNHAQLLRSKGWGVEVVGVDCVSPIEFLTIEITTPSSSCSVSQELDKGYISVRMVQGITDSEMSNPLYAGTYPPYRGSTTRQKVTGIGDRLAAQADPILKKGLQAFSLIGWAVEHDSNLAQVIISLLQSKTDLDPRQLIPDEGQSTGSVHHRLNTDSTDHGGAVSILPNYGSKFSFDTGPMVAYSKGSKNVNLMFQSLMSYATVYLSWMLQLDPRLASGTVHLHVKQSCCVRPVDESPIENLAKTTLAFPSFPDNPFLFISSEKAFPPHLQKLHFQSQAPLANNSEEALSRQISLVAYEIIYILGPNGWGSIETIEYNRALVINWAFQLPLLKTLEMVALLLIANFLPGMRKGTSSDFLYRLNEKILKSPLQAWSQLTNLIHCPLVHHELTAEPYCPQISGNPVSSPLSFGNNLRATVSQIIVTWANNLNSRSRLFMLTPYATSFCGVNLHPSIIVAVQNWLTTDETMPIRGVRLSLINMLSSPQSKETSDYIAHIAKLSLQKGKLLIIRDQLDVLCKKSEYKKSAVLQKEAQNQTFQSQAINVISVTHSQCIYSSSRISTHRVAGKRTYISHEDRPLATPTTGPLKLLSMIKDLPPISDADYLCLGDGSGGFTWTMLRYFPKIRVLYNSKVDINQSIQQAPPIPYLPAFAGWPDLEKRLLPLQIVNEELSDLTHPEFPTLLASKHGYKFDGVICDAECKEFLSGTQPLILANSVLNIALACSSSWILFKTYSLVPVILKQTVSLFLSRFQTVKVIRSLFSSSGNTEVYLLISDPKISKPFTIYKDKVEGYLLPEQFDHFIMNVLLPSLEGRSVIDPYILKSYLEFIDSSYIMFFKQRMLEFIPFVLRKDVIIYPHSVNYWIGESSMKKPALPSLRFVSLESTRFTNPLLVRWIIAYLVIWSSLSESNAEELDSIWLNLVLLWYKLKNGSWEFSLLRRPPPAELQGSQVVVREINKLLTSNHQKLIHRMRGIIIYLKLKVVSLSPDIERGGLTVRGFKLPSSLQAESQWVRDHVQKIDSSDEKVLPLKSDTPTILELWKQKHSKYKKPKAI